MKINLYSIYDLKSQSFGHPFSALSDELALRAFSGSVNSSPGNLMADSPEDFTLYHVGEMDDETGSIKAEVLSSLVNGITLKKETDKSDLQHIKTILEKVLIQLNIENKGA